MRAALIGTGFGEQHLSWLTECPQVELDSVVYATNRERAERLARRFGAVKVSDDAADATDGPSDLVIIASPVFLHAEHAARALSNGKSVVCEKPLALTAAQAQALCAAAKEHDAATMVMFQWRFHPALQALRDALRRGRLGRPVCADLQFHHDFLAGEQTPFPWRHAPGKAGAGAFADMGVHLFDLLRWLTGEEFHVAGALSSTRWTSRRSAAGTVAGDTEDTGTALLRADSGFPVTVSVSRVTGGRRSLRVSLSGDAGSAWADVCPETTAASLTSSVPGVEGAWPSGSLHNPYLDFLAPVSGTVGSHVPDFSAGLAAQRLLDAVRMSEVAPVGQ